MQRRPTILAEVLTMGVIILLAAPIAMWLFALTFIEAVLSLTAGALVGAVLRAIHDTVRARRAAGGGGRR